MPTYDFDLFTIGGGSGGVRASRMASTYGARVGLAEAGHLGGTCVNVGCVPKKLMVYASHFREEIEQAAGFGWTIGAHAFDWPTFIERKNAEITRLNGVYERLLHGAGVKVVHERARIIDAHTVEAGGARFTAEHILIATGGYPVRTHEPGQELGLVSDDVFFMPKLPRRILVAGGGYIAVEFAGIFRGLGSAVTQVYRGPHILRGFDDDARAFVATEMQKKGIKIELSATIECIEKTETGLECDLSNGETLEVDAVIYAIGRKPNVDHLGAAEVGVKLDAVGAVVVDPLSRTSVPSIHAIGDVTNRLNLTPVAIAEGAALARTLFRGEPTSVDYENVPTAVFSQPPLSTVGMTEAKARAKYGEVDVYTSEFRPMKHTLSGSDERTFMKLVVDPKTDRVVGAHMAGMDAPEIIQCLAVAMKCNATKAQLDATIGIHPTAAEEFVTMRAKRSNVGRVPID